jgi:hypothetical protein
VLIDIFPNMKANRDIVLAYLRELEEKNGGYYGTDLTILAKGFEMTHCGLKKMLMKWLKGDPAFFGLHYLGKHESSITCNESVNIESRITSNPLEMKSYILSDINKEREVLRKEPLPKTTFYRATKQRFVTQYPWFESKFIKLPSTYSVSDARDSLSKVFNFSDLKTYGGADIHAIYVRWIIAKEYFSVYGVDPLSFYPEILLRERQLKSLLTSIPSDRHKDVQARLIFEIQATFVVECLDLLLDEIIHKRGRIQQSLNASRQKVENDLRKSALDLIRSAIRENLQKPSPDLKKLCFLSETISEDIKGRMILLRRHKESYHLIFNIIENLMSVLGDNIIFHTDEGLNFYRLASSKTTWENLDKVTKGKLTKNPTLAGLIGDGNEDIAHFLAIDRLVEYIRHGKITFKGSYCFQDIGSRIEEIRVEE